MKLAVRCSNRLKKLHIVIQNPQYATTILVTVGFTARLIMTLGVNPILWSDSLLYYREAVQFLQHGNFSYHEIFHAPAYPLFLAFFLALGKNPIIGALILFTQRLLGLLTTLLIFAIAKRVFPPRVGFFAALLFSIHPLLLYYESVIQTEVMFTFLLCLLIGFVFRVLEKETRLGWLVVGELTALVALTRPVAQLFIYCLALLPWLKSRDLKKSILPVILLLSGYQAIVYPWKIINEQTFGFFGVSRGQGINLFFRVFEADKLPLPTATKFPDVQAAHQRELFIREKRARKEKTVYFHVRRNLTFRKHYTSLRADQVMFGYALEAVKEHPVRFAINTFKQISALFFFARDSINTCYASDGPYLCCERTAAVARDGFRNSPTSHPWVRKFISLWFQVRFLETPLMSIFAFWGMYCFFKDNRNSRLHGGILVATVVYFAFFSCLLNVYEDRFRLVVEPFLFLFAVYGGRVVLRGVLPRRLVSP